MLAALLFVPLTCQADGAREKSVAATFNEYCLTNPSSFASLSDRATSEHLQVDLERDIPMPNGGGHEAEKLAHSVVWKSSTVAYLC
jgi:hypothetical protein